MVLAHQPKRHLSVHAKKRHGLHHKTTKQYGKTYWPYLPMLLIVGLGLLFNSGWSNARNVLGYSTRIDSSSLLQDTNAARAKSGLKSLQLNTRLAQAAQAKANDMVAKNYWSHVSPGNVQPWQFISSTDYSYKSAGENLAYGFASSEETLSGWMNSPEHRANVLNANYKDVGFGFANSPNFQNNGNQTVVVAMYADPQPFAASSVLAAEQTLPAKQIARINTLTNGQFGILAITVIAGLAAAIFVFKHSYAWKRRLVHGEEFVITHPLFDTFCILAMVVGVLLTRISGFIH